MSHTIYLGLGTNLGDRLQNLQLAAAAMRPGVQPVAFSPVYETPPWGYSDQPSFLNQVIQAETDLPPERLLVYIKELEANLGRQPTFRYGPRLIDIDILLYGDLIFSSPELVIPHPALHERAFMLVPLADLVPDLLHPVLQKTIRELLEQVDTSQVCMYQEK